MTARHRSRTRDDPWRGLFSYRLLWVVTIALLGMGMVMIASTTLHRTDAPDSLNVEFLIKQAAAVVLGLRRHCRCAVARFGGFAQTVAGDWLVCGGLRCVAGGAIIWPAD